VGAPSSGDEWTCTTEDPEVLLPGRGLASDVDFRGRMLAAPDCFRSVSARLQPPAGRRPNCSGATQSSDTNVLVRLGRLTDRR